MLEEVRVPGSSALAALFMPSPCLNNSIMTLILGSGRTMQGAFFCALAGSVTTLKLILTTSVAGTSGFQTPGSVTILALISTPVIKMTFGSLVTPLYN